MTTALQNGDIQHWFHWSTTLVYANLLMIICRWDREWCALIERYLNVCGRGIHHLRVRVKFFNGLHGVRGSEDTEILSMVVELQGWAGVWVVISEEGL